MQSSIDDGVIKFNFELDNSYVCSEKDIQSLESWRLKLYDLGLIGEYWPERVGFGNISNRLTADQFIISATQTGKYRNLKSSQYTLVQKADLSNMSVHAKGQLPPSSESLTHYAIYKSCKHINTVFHIHNKDLWEFMLQNDYIKTKDNINYGTEQMAIEAVECIGKRDEGIFAMTGHEDGIIAYAKKEKDCYQVITELISNYRKSTLQIIN